MIFFATVQLVACKTVPPVGVVAEEGFEAFATPRSFDGAGTIYRIDSEGKRYLVGNLDVKVPDGADEVIPSYTTKKEISVTQLLESIGAKAELIPASLNSNFNIKSNASIEGTNGYRVQLSDTLVDGALLKWRSSVTPVEGSKYYLIRETIQTPSLKYKVEKNWLMSAVVDIKYLQVAGYKGEPKITTANTLELDAKFTKPMNVWYKAQLVTFKPGLGAGGAQFIVVKEDIKAGILGL